MTDKHGTKRPHTAEGLCAPKRVRWQHGLIYSENESSDTLADDDVYFDDANLHDSDSPATEASDIDKVSRTRTHTDATTSKANSEALAVFLATVLTKAGADHKALAAALKGSTSAPVTVGAARVPNMPQWLEEAISTADKRPRLEDRREARRKQSFSPPEDDEDSSFSRQTSQERQASPKRKETFTERRASALRARMAQLELLRGAVPVGLAPTTAPARKTAAAPEVLAAKTKTTDDKNGADDTVTEPTLLESMKEFLGKFLVTGKDGPPPSPPRARVTRSTAAAQKKTVTPTPLPIDNPRQPQQQVEATPSQPPEQVPAPPRDDDVRKPEEPAPLQDEDARLPEEPGPLRDEDVRKPEEPAPLQDEDARPPKEPARAAKQADRRQKQTRRQKQPVRVAEEGDPDPGGDGDDDDDDGGGDDPNRRRFVNRAGNIVPGRARLQRVRGSRPTMDHRFCMSILRSMVVEFTKGRAPATEIPTILTNRDDTASKLCWRCRGSNRPCPTAYRAMLGDARDLVALLTAAKEAFIDRPLPPDVALNPRPSAGIVADLVLAAWQMLAAFVSADRAYRKAHQLTTDPRHQRRPAELLLLPVLEARAARIQSLLTSGIADPDRPGFGTDDWRALTLLRLEEGDGGHELWSRHRTLFLSKLKRARELWAAEPGVVSTAEELCGLPTVGPYGGEILE